MRREVGVNVREVRDRRVRKEGDKREGEPEMWGRREVRWGRRGKVGGEVGEER